MKKIFIILAPCIFILSSITAQTKMRKATVTKQGQTSDGKIASKTAQELFSEYRFNDAITQLQKEIALKKRQKQSAESEQRDLANAQKGARMLLATQKIIIVDSIVTTLDNFLSKIQLSNEAGVIETYNKFFKSTTQPDAYVYQNELGNKCYFSKEDSLDNMQLYTSDKLDGKWSNPVPLKGLNDDTQQLNYPFMLGDGITLYFASMGEESLGGYDIFVTRYDSQSDKFLKPENLGMPFNSPANDYMYAEDDATGIGWFVTDRNQMAGNVCIYIFIPSDIRQTYSSGQYTEEDIRRAARINSIAETWGDGTARNKALARLQEMIKDKANTKKKKEGLNFVINDSTIYQNLSDFKSSESKHLISEILNKSKRLTQANKNLDILRQKYFNADKVGKSDMKGEILLMEQQTEQLEQEIRMAEKTIRNNENTILNK